MVRCPNCGNEVANPRKSWKMAGRPDLEKRTELTIGLFDCSVCGRSFKKTLDKQKMSKATLKLKEKLDAEEIDYIKKSLDKKTE